MHGKFFFFIYSVTIACFTSGCSWAKLVLCLAFFEVVGSATTWSQNAFGVFVNQCPMTKYLSPKEQLYGCVMTGRWASLEKRRFDDSLSSCSRGHPVPSAAAARDKEETLGPSLGCEYTCTYLSLVREDRVLEVEYSWDQSTEGWCQTEYWGFMSDRVLGCGDWCQKDY